MPDPQRCARCAPPLVIPDGTVAIIAPKISFSDDREITGSGDIIIHRGNEEDEDIYFDYSTNFDHPTEADPGIGIMSATEEDLQRAYEQVSTVGFEPVEFITIDFVVDESSCQCGSDSVGSPIHSSWCPKYEKQCPNI
jgi:hypothetical protein